MCLGGDRDKEKANASPSFRLQEVCKTGVHDTQRFWRLGNAGKQATHIGGIPAAGVIFRGADQSLDRAMTAAPEFRIRVSVRLERHGAGDRALRADTLTQLQCTFHSLNGQCLELQT